jgi:hypothetical protein
MAVLFACKKEKRHTTEHHTMIMNLICYNGAQRYLAILSTAFTGPPVLCMMKLFGFQMNGHWSDLPSSVSNLPPNDLTLTMELIMTKIDKEASFGDQGHVFTTPRRLLSLLIRLSSLLQGGTCRRSGNGVFGAHAPVYHACFWFAQGQEETRAASNSSDWRNLEQ